MFSLYIDESDCDFLTGSGREPAITELRCGNCGDGLRFDQNRCETCGQVNLRFHMDDDAEFNPRRPIAAKSIGLTTE